MRRSSMLASAMFAAIAGSARFPALMSIIEAEDVEVIAREKLRVQEEAMRREEREARRREFLPSSLQAGKPPQNGGRETARRLRRIQAGTLKAANGLVRS